MEQSTSRTVKPTLIDLQKALGHVFSNQALFMQALTHRSYAGVHYERLEFLGDSVLNCAVSMLLIERFPDLDEGRLSRIRSHLVKQDCLARIGRELNLDQCMQLGAGEIKSGRTIKDSIIADSVEALFGAILLDADFDRAKSAVFRLLTPVLDSTPEDNLGKDAKTRLQEQLQAQKLKLPIYTVLVEGGTTTSPNFEVQCTVECLGLSALGVGTSRRLAEQEAASFLLDQLSQQSNIKGGV
ncbi:ribonuclease III [Limnobacter humi]|uniref:Ribonuclease 3 n=1 Tax=Limnobacter humi TaxID=1778671 RepID=A0ABT1WEW4_9BURK|nr:ribonuclease III [Limnobacter humi]MCQ8895934.1 ribonuclease III [Limnobacter humi]